MRPDGTCGAGLLLAGLLWPLVGVFLVAGAPLPPEPPAGAPRALPEGACAAGADVPPAFAASAPPGSAAHPAMNAAETARTSSSVRGAAARMLLRLWALVLAKVGKSLLSARAGVFARSAAHGARVR